MFSSEVIVLTSVVIGPLVRIGPNELHCNDPAFIDEIYASSGRKRDKQVHYLAVLAGPSTKSAFGTEDHDLHRIRRSAMNKFFSRADIMRLEKEILELTNLMCDKFISMYAIITFPVRTNSHAFPSKESTTNSSLTIVYG